MKIALPLVGGVMIIVGFIFFFQGIGVLLGSPMTRVTFWSYVGVIMIVAGFALLVVGIRGRRQS